VSDVAAICFRALLDIGASRGLPASALLDGLGIEERDLRTYSRRRYAWNAYVTILERMAELLGGLDELAEAGKFLPKCVACSSQ
jgi:hypothetical protein